MPIFNATGANYLIPPSIPLATKRGREIPNEQWTQRPRASMEAARDIYLANHPSITVRSLRSVYNCMGMIFSSRRTLIDTDQLEMILQDDEFRRVRREEDLTAGDLVVYRGEDRSVTHVGIVSRIDINVANATRRVMVLSQWGWDGEYLHEVSDVHTSLGHPAEYWTDRI